MTTPRALRRGSRWLPAILAVATFAPATLQSAAVASPSGARAPGIQIFQQHADATAAQVTGLVSQVTALELGANPARATAGANSSRANSYAGVVDVAALEAAAPQANQLYCYSSSPGLESCTSGTGEPTSAGGMTVGVGTAEAKSKSVRDDASETVANGRASAAGLAGPAFQIGSASSHATVYTKDGKLTSLSSAKTEDVDIAGVLHIGSVTSEARTSLSGSQSSSTAVASTLVTDIQVAGIPVILGEDGLVVAGQNIPLTQVRDIQEQVNSALEEAGIRVEAVPSSLKTLTEDGTEGSAETTGLQLAVSQQLPQRAAVRLRLGRALAFGAFRLNGTFELPADNPVLDPLPGAVTGTTGPPGGGLPVQASGGEAVLPAPEAAPAAPEETAPTVALAPSRPASGPRGTPDLDFIYLCLLLATAGFVLPFAAAQIAASRTATERFS